MGDQSSGGLASSKRRGADAGLAIGSPPFCDHRSSSSCRFSRRVDRALHTMMARRRSLPPLRAARLVALLCVTSCAVSALHMPNLAERVFSERSGGRMQSIRERGAAWHAQRQQQLQLKVRSHHAAGLQVRQDEDIDQGCACVRGGGDARALHHASVASTRCAVISLRDACCAGRRA